uniref:Chlorophyll a-chlorophyll c-peridinin-protein-complex I-4, acpPCI-4 n=1 Tax=Amphidinium carterae TaxID=2961 RepID=UPI002FE4FAB5
FAGGLTGSDYGGFGGKYEWDPVGFSTRWPEHLAWYREAELKHGRIAMLAFAGLLAPDLFRLPWAEFQDSSLDFANAHDKFVAGFGPMWWGFIACGGIEYQRFRKLGLGMEGLTLENAGNLGWFDLPKNSEERLFYETAELKNGRLAMLAVSGIFTAGIFWDQHHFPFI